MEKLIWHTEKRKVNDLVPFEENPRKLTEEQARRLKESIEKFNLVEIPAIDLDNKIVAGHQRMNIMQLVGRGDEEVEVRVPNRKLTQEEFMEYNLRSNKNTGEWDFNVLANFDLNMLLDTGFTAFELQQGFGVDDLGPQTESGTKIMKQMTFTLSEEQVYKITIALKMINPENWAETFGNSNKRGNNLFTIISQWVEDHKNENEFVI